MPDHQAQRLALILQAIDRCDKEFDLAKEDYKKRRNILVFESAMLRNEILSGQMTLVTEPPPEETTA